MTPAPEPSLPDSVTWSQWASLYTDVGTWVPAVGRIWEQNPQLARLTGVARPGRIEPGFPGTCAVFVVDDRAVVKFFPPFSHMDYERERCILEQFVGRHPALPDMLAAGTLQDRIDWPYLVLRFESANAWRELRPVLDQPSRLEIASELGRMLRAVHDWPLGALLTWPLTVNWSDLVSERVREAPQEIIGLAGLRDEVMRGAIDLLQTNHWNGHDPCLVHADLTEDHILVDEADGGWRLAAVIDWADAEIAGPVYDWVALWFSFCGRDSGLFSAFLAGYDPAIVVDPAFTEQLMTFTLLHRFGPRMIADSVPPPRRKDIASLAELTKELFPGLP